MKKFLLNSGKRRLFTAALLLGLCAALAFEALSLNALSGEIRENLLRLHIVANSDSPADQQLKIKVRDRLLKEGRLFLGNAETKEQAEQIIRASLPYLTDAARDELEKNGCGDGVCVTLGQSDFSTRKYDGITLPAGEYEALRVVIGRGEGKNWWCVMFPPMCVSAGCEVASDGERVEEILSDGGAELVSGGDRYKVKFKAVEIYESVKSAVCRLFGEKQRSDNDP